MKTAKTAISIPQKLLAQTDKAAQETGNSRSGIVVLALSRYLEHLKQEQILAQLNEVYENEASDAEDTDFLEQGKIYFERNITGKEQW